MIHLVSKLQQSTETVKRLLIASLHALRTSAQVSPKDTSREGPTFINGLQNLAAVPNVHMISSKISTGTMSDDF